MIMYDHDHEEDEEKEASLNMKKAMLSLSPLDANDVNMNMNVVNVINMNPYMTNGKFSPTQESLSLLSTDYLGEESVSTTFFCENPDNFADNYEERCTRLIEDLFEALNSNLYDEEDIISEYLTTIAPGLIPPGVDDTHENSTWKKKFSYLRIRGRNYQKQKQTHNYDYNYNLNHTHAHTDHENQKDEEDKDNSSRSSPISWNSSSMIEKSIIKGKVKGKDPKSITTTATPPPPIAAAATTTTKTTETTKTTVDSDDAGLLEINGSSMKICHPTSVDLENLSRNEEIIISDGVFEENIELGRKGPKYLGNKLVQSFYPLLLEVQNLVFDEIWQKIGEILSPVYEKIDETGRKRVPLISSAINSNRAQTADARSSPRIYDLLHDGNSIEVSGCAVGKNRNSKVINTQLNSSQLSKMLPGGNNNIKLANFPSRFHQFPALKQPSSAHFRGSSLYYRGNSNQTSVVGLRSSSITSRKNSPALRLKSEFGRLDHNQQQQQQHHHHSHLHSQHHHHQQSQQQQSQQQHQQQHSNQFGSRFSYRNRNRPIYGSSQLPPVLSRNTTFPSRNVTSCYNLTEELNEETVSFNSYRPSFFPGQTHGKKISKDSMSFPNLYSGRF